MIMRWHCRYEISLNCYLSNNVSEYRFLYKTNCATLQPTPQVMMDRERAYIPRLQIEFIDLITLPVYRKVVQGPRKKYVNHVKQDPDRARQNS